METATDPLLIALADHTEVMHQALEGKELPFEERMIYLGHLGMCARIFKSICLDETSEATARYVRIEQSSFSLGTPNDQRGSIARESWALLEPVLLRYLANKNQAEQADAANQPTAGS